MKIKFILRVVVFIFLIGSFLLVSCTGADSPPSDSTLEASQTPALKSTITPTATATPEPTEAGPSTANLPEGWAGRIDRIETMVEMDGKTTRVVAIQKSADPNGESKLRVLQWDGAAREWVSYEPQVGWAGFARSSWYNTYQEKDLLLPDRSSLAPPLLYNDGTEAPVGLLGSLYDKEGGAGRSFFMQGYILDIDAYSDQLNEKRVVVRVGVPLDTGDWQVVVYKVIPSDTDCHLYSLADFSGEVFGRTFEEAGVLLRNRTTFDQVYDFFIGHADELVGRPIITKMSISDEARDPDYYSYEQALAVEGSLQSGVPSLRQSEFIANYHSLCGG